MKVSEFIDFALKEKLDYKTILACAKYVDGPVNGYDNGARAGLCEELKYVASVLEDALCLESSDGKHKWSRVIMGPHDEILVCEFCHKED